MSRTLNRSIARREYARFAKAWREDLRKAGLYGKPRSPKRPTFNQWYALHLHDVQRAAARQRFSEFAEGVPAPDSSVLATSDPWAETPGDVSTERGVVTIDMVGRDED